MSGFTVHKQPEGRIEILPEDITVDEFIILAGASLELALKSAYNQINKTEEDDKELRAALYDRLILITTDIANSIYPEHIDLYDKTPEAMLESLEKRINELKELKDESKEGKEIKEHEGNQPREA